MVLGARLSGNPVMPRAIAATDYRRNDRFFIQLELLEVARDRSRSQNVDIIEHLLPYDFALDHFQFYLTVRYPDIC